MPEMNGLETVPEIRKLDRRVPIIMFSTRTERGAEATLEALSRGATDYVTKPSKTDMESTSHHISGVHQGPWKNVCRHSADVLFRPVPHIYGTSTRDMILPRMGQQVFK